MPRPFKENPMRPVLTVLFVSALAVSACAQKGETVTLKEGTPAYALAKDLAATMPALGPDKTTVMIETKDFDITAAEVIQAVRANLGTRADQLRSVDAGQLKRLLEQAASSLAERKLLLAAARAAKTVCPPAEVDQAMQSEFARAGSEQAFLEALKGAEITIDHVKRSVEETLIINKLLAGVVEKGSAVTEDELRQAYGQETTGDKTATVRHILIMTQGKNEQEKAAARTEIEGLLAKAKAGADFAELAKQYTQDTGSKENGGLYEDFPRGRMVKPFEDAAFSVPVGELSGVVETQYGYHILKVIERKKETRPFDEVRSELEERLKKQKQGTVVEQYVQALKDKAKYKVISL
jgi:parvulin-like peptidyl-prolyl isomerase